MCSNAMFCSTDTRCFDYQSNDKAGHSGKTMSAGVRKRKWHKLCEILFTIFLFQKIIPTLQLHTAQRKKCITIFGKERKR